MGLNLITDGGSVAYMRRKVSDAWRKQSIRREGKGFCNRNFDSDMNERLVRTRATTVESRREELSKRTDEGNWEKERQRSELA